MDLNVVWHVCCCLLFRKWSACTQSNTISGFWQTTLWCERLNSSYFQEQHWANRPKNISYSVFRAHHHPSLLCYNEDWLCNLFALFADSSCLQFLPTKKKKKKQQRKKENLKDIQKLDTPLISFPLLCLVSVLRLSLHPQNALGRQQ